MTTSVTIKANGPYPVLVTKCERGSGASFPVKLLPEEDKVFTVWDGVTLLIEEIDPK